MTTLTNSELSTLRECPQKWGFAYRERLRPRTQAAPMALGTAAHEGLAAGYREQLRALSQKETPSLDAMREASRLAALAQHSAWLSSLSELPLLDRERLEADAAHVPALLEWMLGHFWSRVATEIESVVPLAIEHAFKVAVRSSTGRAIRGLSYRGVIDLVYYDRQAGDIVVLDHKTTSGEVSSIDRRIELDPQMAGYLWSVRELLRRDGERALPGLAVLDAEERARITSGAIPTGRIAYNVLRTKLPKTPEVTQKGLVSSAAIDTLPDVYEEALRAQELRGAPRTEAQVARLEALQPRRDAWHARREFYRSDADLERWRREVELDAKRHRRLTLHPDEITRNPGACSSAWSMPCAYRAVCLDPSSEDLRAAFRVATSTHEEVVQAAATTQNEWGF